MWIFLFYFLLIIVCGKCILGNTNLKEEDVTECGVCKNVKESLVLKKAPTESKCKKDCSKKTIELCDKCFDNHIDAAKGIVFLSSSFSINIFLILKKFITCHK